MAEQIDAFDFLTTPGRFSAWGDFVGIDAAAARISIRRRAITGVAP